jgi:hypothetical protein
MQGPLPDVEKDGPLARRERWEGGARSAGERKDERILSSFCESVNKALDWQTGEPPRVRDTYRGRPQSDSAHIG